MKVWNVIGIILLMGLFCGCSKAEQPKYEKINVYENVVVEVSGISPYATATIKLLSDKNWYSEEDFVIDKSENIKNGDILKVECTISKERQNTAFVDLILTEKKYTVNGTEMYVNQLDQLSELSIIDTYKKCVEKVCKDTENTEDRMMYRLSGSSNYLFQYNKEWVENIGIHQVILCTPMNYQDEKLEKNIVFLVLEATIANGDYMENGYYIFEYNNLVVSADGTIHWPDLEEQTYFMATDLDELEQMLIASKSKEYYVGQKSGEEYSINFEKTS